MGTIWVRLVGGILLLLLGLVWIGQGLNILKGSGMSGQGEFVVVGALVALGGCWLLYGVARTRVRPGRAQ